MVHRLIPIIALFVFVSACSSTRVTANTAAGIEWNVSVHKAVEFNDSLIGVGTDYKYSVADTARVNEAIAGIKLEMGQFTFGWTLPSDDGSIWLVAYEPEPLWSENATVTSADTIPSNEGAVQLVFKFPDAQKWESVTKDNIGKRLAMFMNGQLMNAPQVNTEITSGKFAASIPYDYLPNLGLENYSTGGKIR